MSVLTRRVELPGPVDPIRTLTRSSQFLFDPTIKVLGDRVVTAFHTVDGPATVDYRAAGERAVDVSAWGPGAAVALELAPDHLGARDRPEAFLPSDPMLAPLARRFVGLRFNRAPRVLSQLLPTIISQKVTGQGAARSWRELLGRYGAPAPPHPDDGPVPGLRLIPTVERLRELSYYDFHPLGLERRRAQVILEVVRRARRLEALAEGDPDVARGRLMAMTGIGPWTTGHVLGAVFGDADAVPVGDYHLPNLVAYAFTGAPRGDDAQMLELLEPYRPHRGRVIALLMAGGHAAPRYGPRLPVRDIRGH